LKFLSFEVEFCLWVGGKSTGCGGAGNSMGSLSCLQFSFIEFKLKQLEHRFRACGLRSQLVNLDNDTAIHCWVPASALTSQDGQVGCKSSSVAAASKKLETKPALMLIHGFAPNALLCWENQVGTLAKEFDVYIPDLLFFGNSTTKLTEKRWTESFQAECLMQMLQLVGVQNQIQLVGTSYGGMVAFRMAEMYPNFVKNVVISSSGVGFMSTSLDELLARSNLSSISELLLPSSVKGMKVFLANVTYKAMWLPNFILHDMLQVSQLIIIHYHKPGNPIERNGCFKTLNFPGVIIIIIMYVSFATTAIPKISLDHISISNIWNLKHVCKSSSMR